MCPNENIIECRIDMEVLASLDALFVAFILYVYNFLAIVALSTVVFDLNDNASIVLGQADAFANHFSTPKVRCLVLICTCQLMRLTRLAFGANVHGSSYRLVWWGPRSPKFGQYVHHDEYSRVANSPYSRNRLSLFLRLTSYGLAWLHQFPIE